MDTHTKTMPYNQKSQPDGKCYRSACKRKHDFQWNTSTEAYYCIGCRVMITRYPENKNLFEDHRIGPKHPCPSSPGLVYYAKLNDDIPSPVVSWMVVAESNGHATEGHDDWFANFWDANEVAKQVSQEPHS
jgi:hypothetical protein